MLERLLIVDYDGTVTEDDVLDRVADHFAVHLEEKDGSETLDNSSLTLHDVIKREYAAVRANRSDVIDWVLANACIRKGFHKLVELANAEGWKLIVLSSGFYTLIDPVLSREGLEDVCVIANDVDPDPGGWRVRFLDESLCDICGEACKRRTLLGFEEAREVVYIGDGYSDRCAAETADLVFARSNLALHFARKNIDFELFETFDEIVDQLRC